MTKEDCGKSGCNGAGPTKKHRSLACVLDESTDFGGQEIARWIIRKVKKVDV